MDPEDGKGAHSENVWHSVRGLVGGFFVAVVVDVRHAVVVVIENIDVK